MQGGRGVIGGRKKKEIQGNKKIIEFNTDSRNLSPPLCSLSWNAGELTFQPPPDTVHLLSLLPYCLHAPTHWTQPVPSCYPHAPKCHTTTFATVPVAS
jgi:hypothetical protein